MIDQALGFISGIMKPATDLIDEVVTSDEERLQLKNTFQQIQNELAMKQTDLLFKQMELEKEISSLSAKMISAEVSQGGWLSRSWRPITMLVFVGIIVIYVFGWVQVDSEFAREFLDLVKIGLGGYVVGRSFEKTSTTIGNILKKK